MYSIGITITLCILAGSAYTQDYQPTFIVAPQTDVVEGDSLTMKCEVNAGPEFMADRVLRFSHRNGKTGGDPTPISNQGSLVDGMAEKGYKVEYSFVGNFNVEISVSPVTADMDGEFLCQVKTQSSEEILEEVSAPVRVLGGVERVALVVENTEVMSVDEPLDSRPGQLSVGCMSYGSNPEPMIHLTFGDTDINADVNTILDEDSTLPRRSFKGEVTTMIDFTPEMFGKKLSCHAETVLPDGVNVQLSDASASAIINGIVDEPTIECSNNTAGMKDKHITLKCKVSKVPKMKRVFFNVGNKYQIYPGNTTDDLITCSVNEFDMDNNEYVLQFYQMEDWHFTVNIYLEVLGYDGAVFKYPVYLMKDNVSGSTNLSASLLVLACSVLAALSALRSS